MTQGPPNSTGGRARFSIRIEGPRVGKARLSAADFAEIVRRTQQALRRVALVLYAGSSTAAGRNKRDIEDSCEVFVVGWKPGSAVAELELGKPKLQLSLFESIGEQSLKAFLAGINTLRDLPRGAECSLPPGFDMGVLHILDALGRVLGHGIDVICYKPERGMEVSAAAFSRPLWERVRDLLVERVTRTHVEKVGRLEVLDGHAGLRGRLWEPDGTKWLCQFEPEHMELLPELWLRTVKVVGEAHVGRHREPVLKVKTIAPLDLQTVGELLGREGQVFPRSTSLEEMAQEQGILPADDLDSISALWPVDDDPDELLRHILAERSARRRAGKKGR